jgi:hypothetical protein
MILIGLSLAPAEVRAKAGLRTAPVIRQAAFGLPLTDPIGRIVFENVPRNRTAEMTITISSTEDCSLVITRMCIFVSSSEPCLASA